ncbi:MAG: sigma-70 family RNA polymerase sigma factor [Planctomycetaceae bacterium]|nr:sigma-70 family RNA polymerase sigma factor [Planctomycetaceae bacterium]
MTTRWSVVSAAGRRSSPEASLALESLCKAYWYPLYAFVRRRGKQPDDARDLTQEFFARVLEKEYLDAADCERGRFRNFLLTVFKRFLANEHQRDCAQKRGGGQILVSIDCTDGERRLMLEPSHDWTPEQEFERRWAVALLEQVLNGLQRDYESKGKAHLFAALKPYLTVDDDPMSYAQIAADLAMTVGAVKVATHRLRQRYRDSIRREVASTVENEGDTEGELLQLLNAIRGG